MSAGQFWVRTPYLLFSPLFGPLEGTLLAFSSRWAHELSISWNDSDNNIKANKEKRSSPRQTRSMPVSQRGLGSLDQREVENPQRPENAAWFG